MRYALHILLFCLLSTTTLITYSKSKNTCPVNPSYDITITTQLVRITHNNQNLSIYPDGSMMINGQLVTTIDSKSKLMAQKYQGYLRKKLPNLAKQSIWYLNDVKNHFDKAIKLRLQGNTYLLNELNDLFNKLVILLNKSINTQNNVTNFNSSEYNLIRKNGEKLARNAFFSVLGNSIKHMELFKNYKNLKAIANEEWRQKKKQLKDFDQSLCQEFIVIENHNNELFNLVN